MKYILMIVTLMMAIETQAQRIDSLEKENLRLRTTIVQSGYSIKSAASLQIAGSALIILGGGLSLLAAKPTDTGDNKILGMIGGVSIGAGFLLTLISPLQLNEAGNIMINGGRREKERKDKYKHDNYQ